LKGHVCHREKTILVWGEKKKRKLGNRNKRHQTSRIPWNRRRQCIKQPGNRKNERIQHTTKEREEEKKKNKGRERGKINTR